MFNLEWDKTSERIYETGLDRGVLYTKNKTGEYNSGVAWNGLTAVNESPSGAEASPFYADNRKYANIISNEEFGCSIEAYTYPEEFEACEGSVELVPGVSIGQQTRSEFGFSYRTLIGNDTEGQNLGYKIHLVYNAYAAPSEKGRATINESPEPTNFSWDVTTTPVDVTGHKPTAHLVINSTKVSAEKLAAIENILYGSGETEARLPLPDEVATIIGEAA